MSVCLMLHGLGPPPPRIPAVEVPYWLSTETFSKIVELARNTKAHITIDDGNASDIQIALPVLQAAGLSATFFIPSGRIGQPDYVSEGDIRTLHVAGMEIGSHGCEHLRWTEVSDKEIEHDVTRSLARLETILGEKIQTVAVPYGDCDRRVLRVLRRLGVRRVYTSFRGPVSEGAWLVRRECITSDMTMASIRTMLEKKHTAAETLMAFLRAWRHAGRAVLWSADEN